MLEKLAEKTWDSLGETPEMDNEDRDLYVYGFYMIFSRIFFFFLTALFGLLFHNLLESVVFFFLFSLIRSYAGGIHASTEIACTILTSFAFFASVAMIHVSTTLDLQSAGVAVLIIASICILLIAPLDTAEKQLSEVEKRSYREKSYLSLLFVIALAVVALLIQMHSIFYACVGSLGLEGILLFVGKLKSTI